ARLVIGQQPDDVALAGGTLGKERHVCAFFHNGEEEYRTMLPFICEGFARGEKAIHIVDPRLRTEHLERLSGAGIDVQAALARGQLEVSAWSDTYLPNGTFDREWTSVQVKRMLLRA